MTVLAYLCLNTVYPEYHKDLELLEIEEGASLSELKTAYRELAKVWHPDRFKHDPKLAEKAGKKLAEINTAHERLKKHLGNPKKTKTGSGQPEQPNQDHRPFTPRKDSEPRLKPSKRFNYLKVLKYGATLIILLLVVGYFLEVRYQNRLSEQYAINLNP